MERDYAFSIPGCLRAYGWTIHSRPKTGPDLWILWRRRPASDIIRTTDEAIELCKLKAERQRRRGETVTATIRENDDNAE